MKKKKNNSNHLVKNTNSNYLVPPSKMYREEFNIIVRK